MPYKRWIVELMVPSVTEVTVSAENERDAVQKAEDILDEGEIMWGQGFEHRLSETEVINAYEEPTRKPKEETK